MYCNSLLATLNVRKAIRGRVHGDLGISLRNTESSNPSYRNQVADSCPTCTVLSLIKLLVQDIDIKVETLRYVTAGDPESHDGDLSTMSKANHGVIEAEYELESGQVRQPKRGTP